MPHNLSDYRLVLASGSPRRQQFLRDLGLDFEIRIKEVDEVYPDHLTRAEITDFLAQLKADAFNDSLSSNEILITSDTLVWLDASALGKPDGYDGAREMLAALSGRTHEVFTSVCLSSTQKRQVFHERTAVTFAPISQESITYYLDHFTPFDKAGSYGIQDWLGLTHIEKIEGSYTNVVGLPTSKFYQQLLAF